MILISNFYSYLELIYPSSLKVFKILGVWFEFDPDRFTFSEHSYLSLKGLHTISKGSAGDSWFNIVHFLWTKWDVNEAHCLCMFNQRGKKKSHAEYAYEILHGSESFIYPLIIIPYLFSLNTEK